MTQEHLNYMKQTIEFDLNLYLTGMINSKRYSDNEIRDIGAYVAAHYTHFANSNNMNMTDADKDSVLSHIASIYSRYSKNGFSSSEQSLQRNKYMELLGEKPEQIQKKLQTVTDMFVK